MQTWTFAGLVSAGALALALGACGGSEVASIPPVAPVVQPAPQPDMFASVPDSDSNADQESSGDTGKADEGKTDDGKTDDKADEGKADEGKADKDDKDGGAKKEDAKGKKAKKPAKPAPKKKK
jgi:hypothetical protein